MASRNALVLVSGMIAELPAGDTLAGNEGIGQLMIQNNAIIRLLAGIFIGLQGDNADLPVMGDDDIENLIEELTP